MKNKKVSPLGNSIQRLSQFLLLDRIISFIFFPSRYPEDRKLPTKKDLFLIIFGIPLGILVVLLFFYLIFLVVGENNLFQFIESNRDKVCRAYEYIFNKTLCSE